MPQMAPMSWLMLFLMFSITFILFNMLKFPLESMSINKNYPVNMKYKHLLNWKW
uniref:ATP synthase complex subunit 8 n=1 Tax=Conocephalus differentus TaxID=948348 RepID=A0A343S7F5_9ORTH|nr:ATP synthase F0 subunit 8 [Conocephalus differentus]